VNQSHSNAREAAEDYTDDTLTPQSLISGGCQQFGWHYADRHCYVATPFGSIPQRFVQIAVRNKF
jgi:hypothetical protein